MIRRPPRSTLSSSSAASDVYKRQIPTPTGHGPLTDVVTAATALVNSTELCQGWVRRPVPPQSCPTQSWHAMMTSKHVCGDHRSRRLSVVLQDRRSLIMRPSSFPLTPSVPSYASRVFFLTRGSHMPPTPSWKPPSRLRPIDGALHSPPKLNRSVEFRR